jgi:HEAT repeat protein
MGSPTLPAMITALQSQNFEVKQQAIRILGKLRNVAAIPTLAEILREAVFLTTNDRIDFVNRINTITTVISALDNIGGSDIVPVIIDLLEEVISRQEQNGEIQFEKGAETLIRPFIRALGKICSPEAVPFLVKALQLSSLESYRTDISVALVEIGGPTVIERLRSLLHDPACPQILESTVRNLLQRLNAPDI